jgi:hypothetical protein
VLNAIQERSTPAQRLRLAGLRALAAWVRGDAPRLEQARANVMRLASEDVEPEPAALRFEMTAFVEDLAGLQLLADGHWTEARARFEAAAVQAEACSANGVWMSAGSAMALIERTALLQALESQPLTLDPLRSEGEAAALFAWQPPLVVGLPTPGLPRLGVGESWRRQAAAHHTLAMERERDAGSAMTPLLAAHLRLAEARATAAGGDPLRALWLLRSSVRSPGFSLSEHAIARAALWQMAEIHDALGDVAQRREALAAWERLGPSDAERAIRAAWEAGR